LNAGRSGDVAIAIASTASASPYVNSLVKNCCREGESAIHIRGKASDRWAIISNLSSTRTVARLLITSPRKRCGKSRLLDVVAGLAYSALLCVNATTAAIFRSIGNEEPHIPTLMFDEADALLGHQAGRREQRRPASLAQRGFSSATGPRGGVLGRCRFRPPSTPSHHPAGRRVAE
jgi:hypothetical protein